MLHFGLCKISLIKGFLTVPYRFQLLFIVHCLLFIVLFHCCLLTSTNDFTCLMKHGGDKSEKNNWLDCINPDFEPGSSGRRVGVLPLGYSCFRSLTSNVNEEK